jgi:hypothetical protein
MRQQRPNVSSKLGFPATVPTNVIVLSIWMTLVVLMVLLLPGSRAIAQSEAGSSGIQGVVIDTDSKPIPGTKVTVQNVGTGYSRNVIADSNGKYRALVMPVGIYNVSAQGAAGSARLEGIPLAVGTVRNVNLILTQSAEAASGSAPSGLQTTLEKQDAASGSSFGLRAVTDLPLRGRNFPEFVKLAPAVVQEGDRLGLVISGQRAINSNVAIDGTDFNDALQGNQRGGNESIFFFPEIAVREFQVVRSGLTVEVGRTNAGFVNVATKSGNNNWHGEAFYLNRNRKLTSRDAFDDSLDFRQNHIGGSVSGPIKRDRAFFFVGMEQNYLREPFMVEFAGAPEGVTVPAELQALEGEHIGSNNPTALFTRTDYALNTRDTLNVSYAYSHAKAENFNRELGRDQAATTNFLRTGSSHGLRTSLASVIGNDLINEVKGQVATDDRGEEPNLETPQITIGGFGAIGGDPSRPRFYDTTRYELADNLSKTYGSHEIRSGLDVNVNNLFQQRTTYLQGRYDFKSLADYNARKIDRYRQTLPRNASTVLGLTGFQKELAFYLQDRFSIRERLTLTGGLRWEGQWNPQPNDPNPALPETTMIPNDLAQWQPRVGLAWAATNSGRTVVRLSAGMFDARTPATLFQRITTENGLAAIVLDSKTDKSLLGFLTFPQALTSVPSGVKTALPAAVGIMPDFRNPRSFQTAGTVEHLLPNGIAFSAGYIHNSTWNLQRRLDRNLFPPTLSAEGMPIFPKERPNTSIGKYSVSESSAHSSYDAFVLAIASTAAKRINFEANYTLGRNVDDDSNERAFNKELTMNPFDLSIERGYSKQDVRHNFSLLSWVDLPRQITFSAVVLTHSGFPYTPIVGYDVQNDGNDYNDRAIINGHVVDRNSYREDPFFNLDLRFIKAFRVTEDSHLDFLAEAFNITRALNKNFGVDSFSNFGTPDNPNSTAGQPLFAPGPGQFGGPRQLQLGVRYIF